VTKFGRYWTTGGRVISDKTNFATSEIFNPLKFFRGGGMGVPYDMRIVATQTLNKTAKTDHL